MQSRVSTIRIRRFLVSQPRTKRQRKAVRYIRERIAHYTKLSPADVKLSTALNNLITKEYARRMTPVKVSISIENGKAMVTPFVAVEHDEPARREAPKQ